MRLSFFDNNSDSLTVVICGWATDEKPFLRSSLTKSDRDFLFLFDYSDLSFDFNFSMYKNIDLIAFSYGVFIFSLIEHKFPKFIKKTAVNGTLRPINDTLGIPAKVFELTLQILSESVLNKFYERMFFASQDYEIFKSCKPNRSVESCKNELVCIKNYFTANPSQICYFDKVLISGKDKIIPAKNQLNYWKDTGCILTDSGHFPFYQYPEIIEGT